MFLLMAKNYSNQTKVIWKIVKSLYIKIIFTNFFILKDY
jgi:hypothetical protein